MFDHGHSVCLPSESNYCQFAKSEFTLVRRLWCLLTRARPVTATEVQSITALLHAYGAALGAADVDQMLALYTNDGVILPPHFPPSSGQEALRETYTRIFKTIHLSIKFDIDEIVVMSPEWAFARTTAEGTKTMLATKAAEPHANQELFIVRKEAGTWKIARYAFSTMKPLVQDGVRRS